MAHERLRFYAIIGLVLLKLFNLFGAIWDIQWHASIGRDSFWIPPHIVAAIGFTGLLSLALAAVTYETYLDRRGVRLQGVTRLGGITVAPVFLGVALSLIGCALFHLSGRPMAPRLWPGRNPVEPAALVDWAGHGGDRF